MFVKMVTAVSEINVNNESENSASILLVEDDDVTAYMLTYLLKREGYDVTCFSDGQQAYDAITEDHPFTLALLDVMIPYRNGIELISQIRSMPSWDNTPVIMISGKSQEQDIVKALDAGANDYVTKPFQPGEVLARIRNSVPA
jgi:DNA-binding response OmpR family regulator